MSREGMAFGPGVASSMEMPLYSVGGELQESAHLVAVLAEEAGEFSERLAGALFVLHRDLLRIAEATKAQGFVGAMQ